MFISSLKEPILYVLIAAAIVSIIVESIENPRYGFVDGLAIMSAVLIVGVVTATNDYNKQHQFRKLSDASAQMVEVRVCTFC